MPGTAGRVGEGGGDFECGRISKMSKSVVLYNTAGLPGDSEGKESTYNAGSTLKLGRFPRREWQSTLYSCSGETYEMKTLADHSPLCAGVGESDTTEVIEHHDTSQTI